MSATFSDENFKTHISSIPCHEIVETLKLERIKTKKNIDTTGKRRSIKQRTMKKELAAVNNLEIEDVLSQGQKSMLARDVWKASKFKNDIDAFYESLKEKIDDKIDWSLVKLDEATPESVLTVKSAPNEN